MDGWIKTPLGYYFKQPLSNTTVAAGAVYDLISLVALPEGLSSSQVAILGYGLTNNSRSTYGFSVSLNSPTSTRITLALRNVSDAAISLSEQYCLDIHN